MKTPQAPSDTNKITSDDAWTQDTLMNTAISPYQHSYSLLAGVPAVPLNMSTGTIGGDAPQETLNTTTYVYRGSSSVLQIPQTSFNGRMTGCAQCDECNIARICPSSSGCEDESSLDSLLRVYENQVIAMINSSRVVPVKETKEDIVLRKKTSQWNEDEHKLFLLGLKKYGKGDWRSISRFYVKTRSPGQVASHAQKYYLRLDLRTRKKRLSIHDMTSVDDNSMVDLYNKGLLPHSEASPLQPCSLEPVTHPGQH